MARVYIGLGSNLGDRPANIKNAKLELLNLKDIDIIKESSIEETDPVDFIDQPKFLNQIILIKTGASPHELLHLLKNIETKMGRKTLFSKGPRQIDLDILLYNDIILNTGELTIPHPEIKNREFILRHLIEIDPDITDPVTEEKYDMACK
jgi:2-amino-4-hydroxy-6-hydroxymethyldihydropteridine diphosphokinase